LIDDSSGTRRPPLPRVLETPYEFLKRRILEALETETDPDKFRTAVGHALLDAEALPSPATLGQLLRENLGPKLGKKP